MEAVRVMRVGWWRMLALVGLIAGSIWLVGGPEVERGTAARGATPSPVSRFVGSWRVTPTIGGEAAVALTTINADGTMLTSNRAVQPPTPGLPAGVIVQSLGHGSWRTSGEQTADITFVILQSRPDGTFLGTRTIRGTLALDAVGDHWSGTFGVTVADPDGALVQQTTGTVQAARIGVETPPAGTPSPAVPAATPEGTARDAVEISGLVDHPLRLTVADLQAMPSETVEASWVRTDGSSEDHSFRGVSIATLLQRAGPRLGSDGAAGPRTYLVVTGWDGYQAVVAWGEIEPERGGRPVLLAWEEDGRALPAEHQPFQFVVGDDARDERAVWGVTMVEVRSIEG